MKDQHEKIKGYRDLTQQEIDLMNDCKTIATEVGSIIEKLQNIETIDKRWLEISKIDLQKGFMSLVRSIAQPTTF